MFRRPVIISGIPIDNIAPELAINEVFRLIEEYREDGVPKQVATVNVDFVVNTLDWSLTTIRHPELLDILRQCDLVTADGMPIVWLSRLLGCPLKGRVTGADLVPALAKRAALTGRSLYFLGGKGDVGERAAEILVRENPGLRIAGIAAPFVHTEGPALERADADDLPLVEAINAARPDILLIAFGNPKQELWYVRNRNRLRVPVAIGIGGTFEFITGRVSRAPLWVQQNGLEWIYRIMQEPGRLWKRYFVGLFKYCSLVLPSILFYLVRLGGGKRDNSRIYSGTTGEKGDWAMVTRLPSRLDEVTATNLEARLGLARHDHPIILDCEEFRHADIVGLGFLTELLRHCRSEGRLVVLAGTGFRIWWYLTVNRLVDLFGPLCFPTIEVADEYLRNVTAGDGYRVRNRSDGTVAVSFPGRLDLRAVGQIDQAALVKTIGVSRCIVDLEQTLFIDSAGIIFLFGLRDQLLRGGGC